MRSLDVRIRIRSITGWAPCDPLDDQSETCPIAQLIWRVEPDGRWYISFFRVEQARDILPMMVAFRQVWRDRGRPRIWFHCRRSNVEMQRLISLLGAKRHWLRYRSYRLDVLPERARIEGRKAKELSMGIPTEEDMKTNLTSNTGSTAARSQYERDKAAEQEREGDYDQAFAKLQSGGYGKVAKPSAIAKLKKIFP